MRSKTLDSEELNNTLKRQMAQRDKRETSAADAKVQAVADATGKKIPGKLKAESEAQYRRRLRMWASRLAYEIQQEAKAEEAAAAAGGSGNSSPKGQPTTPTSASAAAANVERASLAMSGDGASRRASGQMLNRTVTGLPDKESYFRVEEEKKAREAAKLAEEQRAKEEKLKQQGLLVSEVTKKPSENGLSLWRRLQEEADERMRAAAEAEEKAKLDKIQSIAQNRKSVSSLPTE